jgi:hypothetical protein
MPLEDSDLPPAQEESPLRSSLGQLENSNVRDLRRPMHMAVYDARIGISDGILCSADTVHYVKYNHHRSGFCNAMRTLPPDSFQELSSLGMWTWSNSRL